MSYDACLCYIKTETKCLRQSDLVFDLLHETISLWIVLRVKCSHELFAAQSSDSEFVVCRFLFETCKFCAAKFSSHLPLRHYSFSLRLVIAIYSKTKEMLLTEKKKLKCCFFIHENYKNNVTVYCLYPNMQTRSGWVYLSCLGWPVSVKAVQTIQVYDVGLPDFPTGKYYWNNFIKLSNIPVVKISVMAYLWNVEFVVGSSNESWRKHRNDADATAETVENNVPCQRTSHNTTYMFRLPHVWKLAIIFLNVNHFLLKSSTQAASLALGCMNHGGTL